jgi:hypothetical protein
MNPLLGLAALGAGSLLLAACTALLDIEEAHIDPALSGQIRGSGCDNMDKPEIEVTDDINTDTTWSCQFDYVLKQIVRVNAGATLGIEAGTTIRAAQGRAPPDYAEPGTLIIARGAKIAAVGSAARPIVFTSTAQPGLRVPGQWGGLILLGKASVNQASATVEGVPTGGEYGGSDDLDSSGTLRYVRIEYAGFALSTGKEINGLTLAGVGRGTVIDHIQVRRVSDDCFEFFGGTVDARYLACQGARDDGFDFDMGYRGRLQFLILQQDGSYSNLDDEMNGIEADNESQVLANPSKPRTEPVIFNMTLCGQGSARPTQDANGKERYGMLWRRGAKGQVRNSLILGFEAGVDIQDPLTSVQIEASAFFENTWGTLRVGNIGYPEQAGGQRQLADDDSGFSETGEYGRDNRDADPRVIDCFTPNAPNFAPSQTLTQYAAQPPDDGFFLPVKYAGAVRDAADTWWNEAWTVWSAQ